MVRVVPLVLVLALVACNDDEPPASPTYEVWFRCGPDGGAPCPAEQPCPTTPLGAGGCEDLPGLFDHPATPVEAGRPPGCTVGLAYGNPYYGDVQQTCTCEALDTGVSWICPL